MYAVPTWTKFSEATRADLEAIEAEEARSAGLIPERLLEYLRSIEHLKMDSMPLGAVDHCRRSATRAFRDGRDRQRDHPCYRRTVEFCARYDQVAFDPACDSLTLDFFTPMVERVLARPAAAGEGPGPLALQETMAG